MGKGDKKTRRGKIVLGTYGARRPKKKATTVKKIELPENKVINEAVKPKSKAKTAKKVKEEK